MSETQFLALFGAAVVAVALLQQQPEVVRRAVNGGKPTPSEALVLCFAIVTEIAGYALLFTAAVRWLS